jgi:nucleotide-binding universal stress UspA family protein
LNVRPSILCPIDYSDASAGALQYAAAIARQFETRLIVATVEGAPPTAALDLERGDGWSSAVSEDELARFVSDASADGGGMLTLCEFDVAVGRPAVEILRLARERSCDLIVMSSQGLKGARTPFCGSTTEGVLRGTTRPVLITPPANPGVVAVGEAHHRVRRIVVPVDLSSASPFQAQTAARLSESLQLPLILVHVIEPCRSRGLSGVPAAAHDSNRRAAAEEQLARVAAGLPGTVRCEAFIVSGDPAEEAAKLVGDGAAGLAVMGLHGPPFSRSRIGSVTYRLLCLAQAPVLALPPRPVPAGHGGVDAAVGMVTSATVPPPVRSRN